MPRFLTELFDAYQHTSLIDGIIGDAGSGSKGVAAQIDDAQKVYILQLKDGSGDVFIEAQRLAVGKPDGEKRWMERGRQVCKRIWLHRLPEHEEFCGWQHARFLVRVERTVTDLETGEVKVGNRYWVSNCAIRDADEWMRMTQAYWRCENCQHWTADVFWSEDAKRTPWTTQPEAVFALSILRTLAINILAVLRSLSRDTWSNAPPSWDDIISRVRAIFTVRPTELRRLPSLA